MCRQVQTLKLTEAQGRIGLWPCIRNGGIKGVVARDCDARCPLQLCFPGAKDEIYSNPAGVGFPAPAAALLWRPGRRGAGRLGEATARALHPFLETTALVLGHAKCGKATGRETSDQAAWSKNWAASHIQPMFSTMGTTAPCDCKGESCLCNVQLLWLYYNQSVPAGRL